MWQAPANRMQLVVTADFHSVFFYGKWLNQQTNNNYTPYLPGEAHASGNPSSSGVNVNLTHTHGKGSFFTGNFHSSFLCHKETETG